MFDGFVSENGLDIVLLNQLIENNDLIPQYMKACKDQLKFGCTFATLSADKKIDASIAHYADSTWFFKDVKHEEHHSFIYGLARYASQRADSGSIVEWCKR